MPDEQVEGNEQEAPQSFKDDFNSIMNPATEKEAEEQLTQELEQKIAGQEKEETEELEVEDAEASEDTGEEGEYEEAEIPPALVEAARYAGYEDDEIVKLAETNFEHLEKLGAVYGNLQPRKAADIKSEVEEPKTELLKHLDLGDLEDIDEKAQAVIKQLQDGQNKLIDEINDGRKRNIKSSAEQEQKFFEGLDRRFDKLKSPYFGRTKLLTEDQKLVRKEIYGDALTRMGVRSIPFDEAFDIAVDRFNKSLLSEKDAKQEVETEIREKLDKSKKKFVAKPGGQRTSPKAKTPDEAGVEVVTEKMKEFGLID